MYVYVTAQVSVVVRVDVHECSVLCIHSFVKAGVRHGHLSWWKVIFGGSVDLLWSG